MKKLVLLTAAVLISAGSIQAHGYGSRGYYYHDGWLVPFFFGSMIGYAASRPAVVYTNSPTVIYTTPRTYVVQDSNTPVIVEQNDNVPNQTPVYEERWVYFDDCQCERKVLVNIQH